MNKIRLKEITNEVNPKYTLGLGTWSSLQVPKEGHKAKGNSFGNTFLREKLADNVIASTISERHYKDGTEILISQSEGKRPRRLTVEKAMQLQGFNPKEFSFSVFNNQAYEQIGNSVVVPTIKDTAKQITKILKEQKWN